MPLSPMVLWAQRADRLLLTIDLQSCKDPQISITNDEAAKTGRLTFRGNAHSHATGPEEHAYQLDLEFYGEIDEKDIKQHTTERYITLAIAKKGAHEHWPRLLKAAGKPAPNIKVDWDKWVDEDEEEEGNPAADAGFDLSAFQNFGGMGGGMGGMGGMGGGGMADLMAGMGGGMGGFGGDMSDDEEEGAGEKGGDSDDDLPDLEPVPQQ
ncbi:HSP20-like chaperone [Micractinium conductrix]|uniref:HSP20-like chaperone n=1 Tax=Micractinium conductrix TaxID=554055 RepID=A0A2P6UZK9_9CHLO|nr:HSP20-like chaperone [Micractinium conductrix]|eukprot:PSC67277.1 HSP20-like chaperone [Micractinium conductrix]